MPSKFPRTVMPREHVRSSEQPKQTSTEVNLFDTRKRIQAEVFDDFLEQAEHFLKDGYFQVAAVIAGAVLEDGLRKLCARQHITLPAQPKLDWMNAELAKS